MTFPTIPILPPREHLYTTTYVIVFATTQRLVVDLTAMADFRKRATFLPFCPLDPRT